MSVQNYTLPDTMPADITLERYVLAQLIRDPESYWTAEKLNPSLFFLSSHRIIYSALKQMIAANQPVDLMTLINHLGMDNLRDIGGATYLVSLDEGFVKTSDLPAWVSILEGKKRLRDLLSLADGLESACMRDGANPQEIASASSTAILDAITGHSTKSIEQQSCEEFEVVQRERKGERVTFLKSGLAKLDELHGGYARGEMTVIGGRPAQGKTVALSQAVQVLCPMGIPCKLQSMEMRAGQLLRRIWCGVAKVQAHKLRHPESLSDVENKYLADAMAEVSGWPLEIDDDSAVTVDDLVMRAKASKRRNGTQFLGVDYLQKLKFPGRINERFQAVTDAAVGLSRLAKDEQMAVVVLSSLTNKNGRGRNDPPTLSDLRMSGDIEYEASTALLIHREIDEDTERIKNQGQIIIAKGRSDASGAFPIEFNSNYLMFL